MVAIECKRLVDNSAVFFSLQERGGEEVMQSYLDASPFGADGANVRLRENLVQKGSFGFC